MNSGRGGFFSRKGYQPSFLNYSTGFNSFKSYQSLPKRFYPGAPKKVFPEPKGPESEGETPEGITHQESLLVKRNNSERYTENPYELEVSHLKFSKGKLISFLFAAEWLQKNADDQHLQWETTHWDSGLLRKRLGVPPNQKGDCVDIGPMGTHQGPCPGH